MIEGVELLHGDCLELMRGIPDGSVDMILCDLPYGITGCAWDSPINLEVLWEQYKRLIKPGRAIVLFGCQPFTSRLVSSNYEMHKYNWIWKKNRSSNFFAAKLQPLMNYEDIAVFSSGGINNGSKLPMSYYPQGLTEINKECVNGDNVGGALGLPKGTRMTMPAGKKYIQKYTGYPGRILEFDLEKKAQHPTQKPVALLEYLIKTYTVPRETILDNTMGSGTTGVACVNTGRKFIGIEKDAGYFEVARDRINSLGIF